MAWRHGHGKPGTPGHDHYVNRRAKGLKEDVEQVNELSPATLGSYIKKSAASAADAARRGGVADAKKAPSFAKSAYKTLAKRTAGIAKATDKLTKEDVQIDELSTDTYHSAAKKAAKRAMGDAQGRSGPIFKKYAGMANKFRDKGMSQEKKEKAMKEETLGELSKETLGNYVKSASADVGHKKADAAYSRMSGQDKQADKNTDKSRKRLGGIYTAVNKLTKEETDPGFVAEADNAVAKQIAAKKDAFKTQLQQKIAAKQMNTMQAKANKRLANINASNDKCTCQEGKGKSMTCEMHGDKSKDIKGGKEPIEINPAMREAAELPKKVVSKGHEIAKSLIKHRAGVDNPYAVGMAQAKKSAKMNAYRTDRDKNKED